MQAVGAYGLSFLFVRSGGDYRLLFGIGAAALVLALVADLVAPFPSGLGPESAG